MQHGVSSTPGLAAPQPLPETRAFAASPPPRGANNSLPHLGGADSQGSFWKNTPALSLPSFSPSLLGSCQFPRRPSSDPQAHVECLLGSLGAPLPTPTSPGFPRSPRHSPGFSGAPSTSAQVPLEPLVPHCCPWPHLPWFPWEPPTLPWVLWDPWCLCSGSLGAPDTPLVSLGPLAPLLRFPGSPPTLPLGSLGPPVPLFRFPGSPLTISRALWGPRHLCSGSPGAPGATLPPPRPHLPWFVSPGAPDTPLGSLGPPEPLLRFPGSLWHHTATHPGPRL